MDQNRKPKQYKVDAVTELKEKLATAKSAVLVNYSGMGVKLQQDLKKQLKSSGSTMFVAKNTLFKIAAQEANYPEDLLTDSVLSGQTAIVLSDQDAVAPVQILGKFSDANELPKMKAAFVEGAYYDENGLKRLAKLPSKEVLYAQVIGGIAAPMYGIVGVLQANAQKLVWILEQYKNSKSNA